MKDVLCPSVHEQDMVCVCVITQASGEKRSPFKTAQADKWWKTLCRLEGLKSKCRIEIEISTEVQRWHQTTLNLMSYGPSVWCAYHIQMAFRIHILVLLQAVINKIQFSDSVFLYCFSTNILKFRYLLEKQNYIVFSKIKISKLSEPLLKTNEISASKVRKLILFFIYIIKLIVLTP